MLCEIIECSFSFLSHPDCVSNHSEVPNKTAFWGHQARTSERLSRWILRHILSRALPFSRSLSSSDVAISAYYKPLFIKTPEIRSVSLFGLFLENKRVFRISTLHDCRIQQIKNVMLFHTNYIHAFSCSFVCFFKKNLFTLILIR